MSLEQFSLKGKTALVTGASSGLGACIAMGLAKAGASVVVAARRKQRLQTLVEEIEEEGGRALAVQMDVRDRKNICTAFDFVEKNMGAIDILINNAGVADAKNFTKIDDQSLDFVMGTNFNGVWNVAQETAKRLIKAQQPGSIINIASVLGLTVAPGQTTYCASKGAVIQLTKAMALDLMKNKIRVNAIAPGWIKTEMNEAYFDSPKGLDYIQRMPARRLGREQELIGPIIMLASDAGSFVNGTVLAVDGAISSTSIH